MNFILGGDFNALLSMSKKKEGICPPIKTIQDFYSFVEDNNFSDIFPNNGLYTWTNRHIGFLEIAKRLDRFLFSQSWKLLSFNFKSEILPYYKILIGLVLLSVNICGSGILISSCL